MSLEYLGATPLFRAAIDNDARRVLQLMDDVNACDSAGRSLLQVAVRHATGMSVVGALLQRGAMVLHADPDGVTALHGATQPAVIDALLDAHANPFAVDRDGRIPLHSMMANGAYSAVEQILTRSHCPTAMLAYADKVGDTPLHLAAPGPPLLLGLALSFGADATLRNRAQQTPADCASHPDSIRLLRGAFAAATTLAAQQMRKAAADPVDALPVLAVAALGGTPASESHAVPVGVAHRHQDPQRAIAAAERAREVARDTGGPRSFQRA